jgi:hypothetical protein
MAAIHDVRVSFELTRREVMAVGAILHGGVIAGLYCAANASFPAVCPSGSYCGASVAAPTPCPAGAPLSNLASTNDAACSAYGTHRLGSM